MARAPYKQPHELKSEVIRFRVTKELREKVNSLAESKGITISELMLNIVNKETKKARV